MENEAFRGHVLLIQRVRYQETQSTAKPGLSSDDTPQWYIRSTIFPILRRTVIYYVMYLNSTWNRGLEFMNMYANIYHYH